MSAHTPGPWDADREITWDANNPDGGERHGCLTIIPDDGEERAYEEIAIATIHEGTVGEKTAWANSQLIAAAPSLLEALEAAQWAGETTPGEHGSYECCPWCKGLKPDGYEVKETFGTDPNYVGHQPRCKYEAAIALARGEKKS